MREFAVIGCALAALFLIAAVMMGSPALASADQHAPANERASAVHAHFDSIAGQDCGRDHEHHECGLFSGACANHFAGTPVQYLFVPVSKVPLRPAADSMKFLALVFDLLRPPRT